MAVQKFSHADAARTALWVPSGDPSLGQRLRGICALARRLTVARPRSGVLKFRTIDDANHERDQRTREGIDELRALRARARARPGGPSST